MLGARYVKFTKFHLEDTQILDATLQNLVSTAT